jgi:hypothetical protein
MPERLRTFDLSRVLPGANQRRFPLCDPSVSAVNVTDFMLFLLKIPCFASEILILVF